MKAKLPAGTETSTRDKLIDAAFAVVARDGFDRASVKSIAAEAGVAPGLLHYHFPTREAVLEAALRRALGEYLERSRLRRERLPPEKQIDAFFSDARASVANEREFFRVRLAFAVKALADPALASVLRELNAAAVEETAKTFAAARGGKPTAKDRATAATLKACFDGLMLAWLNDPSFPLDAAGAVLEKAVRGSKS